MTTKRNTGKAVKGGKSSDLVNEIVTDQAEAAELRKQSKLLKQAEKKRRRELALAAAKNLPSMQAPIVAAPVEPAVIEAEEPVVEKMQVVTLEELKDMVPAEQPVPLPEELDAYMLEGVPAVLDQVVELRHLAREQSDYKKAQEEQWSKIGAEMKRLEGHYAAIHAKQWKAFIAKWPNSAEYATSNDAVCRAHKAKIDAMLDMAASKIDNTVARFVELRKEYAEVQAWLKAHEHDHLTTYSRAEEKARSVGANYDAIWPRKQVKAHGQ